jgi:paraquat-inducible protein A
MAEPVGGRRTAAALAAGSDRLVPAAIFAALALLAGGLYLPVMTVDRFFVFSSGFSILDSIEALYEAEEWLLFAAILLFSVVFPALKLGCCAVLWWAAAVGGPGHRRLARLLDDLGRWSMLDVFLVAILLVTIRTAGVGGARTEIGLYLFTAAVIVSMLTVQWIRSAGRRLGGAAEWRS